MKTRLTQYSVVLVMLTLAAGCVSPVTTPTTTPTPEPTLTPTVQPTSAVKPVIFQYIGHSSTLIIAPDGTRIVSDPYGGNRPVGLGGFPANLSADAVTVSHFHPDHCNTSSVKGNPKKIFDPGTYQAGMVKITGLKGDHGLINGVANEDNTVFVFEIGDVKIVHLGAAGVVTQNEILAALENADVVIADVMGDPEHPMTDELNQLIGLHVRTIVPSHYSFDAQNRYYGAATLDEFLQIVPSSLTIKKQGSKLEVTAGMPQQVLVLTPAANGG